MRQKIRIILEYMAAFMVITLLMLSIAGVVVVKFHGDDLKAFVMEQVNDRLDSKVDVEEVSVKVFHKFPNTSIVLRNITVWSSHNFNIHDFSGSGADTLMTAEMVGVSFNLLGMIRKDFDIRQIEVRNGSLRLRIDSKGEENYRLSRGAEKKEGQDHLIEVSQIRIHGFRISLDNLSKQLKAAGNLDNLEVNGKFSKRNTQIKGSLNGSLEEISNKGILYASGHKVGARLNMDVRDSVFTLKSGQVQMDRIVADLDGRFHIYPGKGIELNLIAAARDLEIHEVLDLLPSELSQPLKEIRGNGILQLYARITGRASSTLTPSIEADFQTANANLFWERVPFSLKNLNLTGSYSNGGEFNPVTTKLNIESISAVIGQDHLSGRGEIRNFLEPDFSFELKGDIHPEQWLAWYDSIPLDQATGTVITDIKASGSYDRLKPRGEKFIALDISGGMSLEDVMVRINSKGIPFRALNGSVHIDNDFWEPSFSGTFGKSDFTITGTGLHLLSFLLDGKDPLVASATFRSGYLDLREVLDQLPHQSAGDKTSVVFPENLDLRLVFIIDDFVKDHLVAKNVRGTARYDSPVFYVDSLTMQTMDGTLRGSFGMAQDAGGTIFASVNASLYKLNISELFDAFNNFGQKQVTYEHLKGSISGTSIFSAEFDPSFTIRPASILSENDITIQKGELIGFKPIMALSRFIEVEELRDIRFETLENNILIRENQVIIPVMDIQSNALDLSASGTHSFNNTYEYHLRMKLSDILYKKARGASRYSEFEMAEDESDTRVLFLKVYDNGSGANVEIDREKAAMKIRNDLKNEKSDLKRILNEELGFFKHEDEVHTRKNQDEVQREFYRFEFSEENDTLKPQDIKKKKERQRKKRVNSDTLQNKPAAGFVID
ncbi:MAG: AsmA-like C-terminal region-containing protein [Bacteroidota bacterium]